MEIQEFINRLDEWSYGDPYEQSHCSKLICVQFKDKSLVLKFSLDIPIFPTAIEIECLDTRAYEIIDLLEGSYKGLAGLSLHPNTARILSHPTLLPFLESVNCYIIWENNINWPMVIGRIIQIFGMAVFEPDQVQQTLQYSDYCLPVNILDSDKSRFHDLMQELKVNYSLHRKIPKAEGLQVLSFAHGLVIAREFYVKDTV